jgi:hypothetical protein
MGGILKLIKLIYGSKALSKVLGTRTNVIRLPDNELKQYTKSDLNIEAASDKLAQKAKADMYELLAEYPRMNDAERLIFDGNLRRLGNKLGVTEKGPAADVLEFGTGEKVSPEGIMSLTEKAGQKNPPTTLMGNLESRVKQLEASGKSLEEATEGKGKTLDDILGDVMQSQKTMSKMQDEGLVRAAVRYKMMDDLQKGVLKVPKNLEEVIRGASNEEDVINVFRKNYGEDALEQVDSLVPDFYKMTSPKEAVKKIETDFPNIQPKKIEFPETIDIDKLPPEEFATGGRVGFNEGSKLTDYIKTNISAKTSSSSPEEGIKVKQEILDGIVSLNIPLSKKLKLLGDLNFGKSRAKVDLSELGKKYGIDLGEEVYKDKYLSPGLGAEYITDEGTKFNFMVRPEDKGGSVSVSRSFATGGRVGFADGGSLDEFLKSTTLVSPSGKNYDYDFIQSLPQSLNTAINKFGFDAVIGKDGGVPGKYTPYYSAMEADSGGGTGLKGEYTFLQDYILKPENLVRDYGLEGAKKILTPYRQTTTPISTPAEEMKETYTANVTPSNLYPNNPFYSSAAKTLYPNNPFHSYYSSEEDDDAYDQYMKNLGYQSGGRVGYMGGGSTGLDYLMGIDRTNYQSGGMTLKQLQAKAPPGEFLAYINPEEAGVLKALGGSGKKINGIPSFFASGPGDTGGAGGDDGAGGNDEGGGGSGDTGDMGSEAANAAATAAGAASVGAGVGPTDPGVTVGSMMGNFGRNVTNMARANPISSMIASAVLGPIGSLALNAARAYGPTGTTSTTSTTESDGDGTSNALIQQAIADPLGLNAAARDMSGVDALQQQYRANLGYQSGGRVNFNEGTLDPAKQKQIKQMIKMGADVDTISAITGATPEQIQQIQQTPRTKNADGGRIGFKDGSKLPKEKTTLPINPMMDEGVDLNKRGFLKGAAGVGAGIAALGTGALRLARKGAKKIKDIDIDVGVAMDGDYDDYLERAVASYNTIFNIKANTKAGKKLLDKLAKEKKIVKEKDGSYSADTMGDINSPTIDALQDIKNKSSYNLSFEGNTFKNTDEASEYLRNKYSPLRDDRYNESFLSEDMEEVVDILAPKSAKEVIKERADLIEKTLKQRGDFASGGLSYLQGI